MHISKSWITSPQNVSIHFVIGMRMDKSKSRCLALPTENFLWEMNKLVYLHKFFYMVGQRLALAWPILIRAFW